MERAPSTDFNYRRARAALYLFEPRGIDEDGGGEGFSLRSVGRVNQLSVLDTQRIGPEGLDNPLRIG